MGGFAAAFLVGVWFLRKKQVDIWRYTDAMILDCQLDDDWAG